jgi:hypothetical protein
LNWRCAVAFIRAVKSKPLGETMTLRKIAARAALAALAAAFLFGAAGTGEAAKKKAAPKDPAASFMCPPDFTPVCGTVGGKKQTIANACVAKQMGAKRVKKGACKK